MDIMWIGKMEHTFKNAAECCNTDLDQKISHQITSGIYWSSKSTQIKEDMHLETHRGLDQGNSETYITQSGAGEMQDLSATPVLVGGDVEALCPSM